MHEEMSAQDFAQEFSDSEGTTQGKSLGLGRKVAAALTIAAATLGAPEDANAHDASSHQQTETVEQIQVIDSEIPPLTKETLDNIIENQISGVYQNPFEQDELLTIKFKGDELADERIKSDLENVTLGNLEYEVADTTGKESGSYYVQMATSFAEKDVNLIVIDREESFFELEEGELNSHNETVFTIMHEAAHSFDHQHHGLMHHIFHTDEEYRADGVRNENGSDFVGAIKTMQHMAQDGVPNEEIKQYIEEVNDARIGSVLAGTHFTSPALSVAIDMFEEDPNQVLNLTNEEILEMSEIVQESALDHDFSADAKMSSLLPLSELEEGKLEKFVKSMTGVRDDLIKDPELLDKLMDYTEKNIPRADGADKLMMEDITEMKENVSYLSDQDIQTLAEANMRIERQMEAAEHFEGTSFSITDSSTQYGLMDLKMTEYPAFNTSVTAEFHGAGLWENGPEVAKIGLEDLKVQDVSELFPMSDADRQNNLSNVIDRKEPQHSYDSSSQLSM